jgi:hypothetical protein
MPKKITTHTELEVYNRALEAAMKIFDLSKSFPKEETYSLTDQVRKRRYEAHFISKLSDAESEAAETQVWLEFAVKCGYMKRAEAVELYQMYDQVLRTLVGMITHPETWVLKKK